MEKLYNENGDVAVIISYGYGAGFSTWTDINPMDKRYAELILNKKFDEAIRLAESEDQYTGGIENCGIEWVEKDTRFGISEYDGSESLVIYNSADYYKA